MQDKVTLHLLSISTLGTYLHGSVICAGMSWRTVSTIWTRLIGEIGGYDFSSFSFNLPYLTLRLWYLKQSSDGPLLVFRFSSVLHQPLVCFQAYLIGHYTI